MRAVDAVMECLKAEGVDVVFGLPGGANLPTYDAFVDAGIRHVLVRHEAGGGHAAQGYAKATGRVGVALGTSGPGATNLITPITDAMMDSCPTVFITGQVRTELLGTDGFQEADTIGITMPIVKHSYMVQHPLEIPRAIHEAFYLARTGRPGPVLVDIPVDLSRAEIEYEPVTDVKKALIVAGAVVALELFAIAWIRYRFLGIPMRSSLIFVAVGGVISLAIGVGLGASG